MWVCMYARVCVFTFSRSHVCAREYMHKQFYTCVYLTKKQKPTPRRKIMPIFIHICMQHSTRMHWYKCKNKCVRVKDTHNTANLEVIHPSHHIHVLVILKIIQHKFGRWPGDPNLAERFLQNPFLSGGILYQPAPHSLYIKFCSVHSCENSPREHFLQHFFLSGWYRE